MGCFGLVPFKASKSNWILHSAQLVQSNFSQLSAKRLALFNKSENPPTLKRQLHLVSHFVIAQIEYEKQENKDQIKTILKVNFNFGVYCNQAEWSRDQK